LTSPVPGTNLEWSPDGEELMPGDDVVVGVAVEVAPFPDGCVHPLLAVVHLWSVLNS